MPFGNEISPRTSRFGRKLPHALGENEMQRLIEAPVPSTERGLRDRALLSVAYAAGLRASELVSLRAGDLDLGRGVLGVTGKGNKRRLVPLGEVAIENLTDEYYREQFQFAPARGRTFTLGFNVKGR